MIAGAIILGLCIWAKRRLDPHSDAFRTRARPGWHHWKAPVVPLVRK